MVVVDVSDGVLSPHDQANGFIVGDAVSFDRAHSIRVPKCTARGTSRLLLRGCHKKESPGAGKSSSVCQLVDELPSGRMLRGQYSSFL